MTDRLSVLVIEDEPLIAMMLEDFVDVLGHEIAGTVDTIAGALDAVGAGGFDVAILDVHLRDGVCWPVADALTAANKPFLIASGGFVEAPPAHHASARQLAKPFTLDGVRVALEEVSRV
ncbi:response regulator [Sphingomonas sp. AP4-R1]|uniref:response regulator n=1 Tax=Sphingomonas sp. AP4-R1 TaxID=2735134 RepID=UPI0014938A8B|nr:response regulator [Sphingomonas sp. AP4-R1]QJU58602.1 response regulator [Sphingomonas sp. AP4-R1]